MCEPITWQYWNITAHEIASAGYLHIIYTRYSHIAELEIPREFEGFCFVLFYRVPAQACAEIN